MKQGNQKPATSSRWKSIAASKHAELFSRIDRPDFITVPLSDRTYLIDRQGTLRRAPVWDGQAG